MRKQQAYIQTASPMIQDGREWVTRAKCRTRPATDWDTLPKEFQASDPHARARELCAGCPVFRECARDAVDYPAWGTVRAAVALPDLNSRAETRRAAATALARVALGIDDPWPIEVVQ